MLRLLRFLAIIITIPTLAMLWVNGQREGFATLYFLLTFCEHCAGGGGRSVLLAAHALAAGAFMTAMCCSAASDRAPPS